MRPGGCDGARGLRWMRSRPLPLIQWKGRFLEQGEGLIKVPAEVHLSWCGAKSPIALIALLHSVGLADVSRATSSAGTDRAPFGNGRPSACHGCAVACIGQPPPPSALGPVWGGGLSCSPAAAVAFGLVTGGGCHRCPSVSLAAARRGGDSAQI